MNRTMRAAAMTLAILAAAPAFAQVGTNQPPLVPGARPVTVERIRIPGPSLQGNLEGNEVNREALVLLPPSYASQPNRRYPVVYALHGYFIGAQQWSTEIRVPQTAEGAFAKGAQDMIIVLPDSKTVHNGSMYSNSVTTGNFEDYVWRDVVAYMDSHYRTIANRESRGLVGHSMGGYGASRIGMKHPDVFGSLYLMSPCCLGPRAAGGGRGGAAGAPGGAPEAGDPLADIKTAADAAKLPTGLRTQLAAASAWSPNPKRPPLYLDLPVGDKQQEVLGKWAANAPLAFVDQYIGNLKRYRAIALDVGDEDGLRVDTGRLHDVLDTYGVANSFEIYPGTHTSNIAFRFQDFVLPFFSRTLSFEAAR